MDRHSFWNIVIGSRTPSQTVAEFDLTDASGRGVEEWVRLATAEAAGQCGEKEQQERLLEAADTHRAWMASLLVEAIEETIGADTRLVRKVEQ